MWCDGDDHEYEVTFFYYLVDIYGVAVTTHTHTHWHEKSIRLVRIKFKYIFMCSTGHHHHRPHHHIRARSFNSVCDDDSLLYSWVVCVADAREGDENWMNITIYTYILYSVGKGRCLLCALAAVSSHYICILLMVCVCDSLRCLNDAVQNHIPNAFQWYIFCRLFRANLHAHKYTQSTYYRIHI